MTYKDDMDEIDAALQDAQREEYERGEIESSQSIDHQRELGNKKAGM